MRECSRNRSTIDTTSIVSLTPFTPGRRQQTPRTLSLMRTPAREASYSARMMSSSTSEFILARISAACPSPARRVSRSMSFRKRSRSPVGAMASRRIFGGSE